MGRTSMPSKLYVLLPVQMPIILSIWIRPDLLPRSILKGYLTGAPSAVSYRRFSAMPGQDVQIYLASVSREVFQLERFQLAANDFEMDHVFCIESRPNR